MPDRDPGNSTNLVVALRVRPLSSSEFGDKEIIHVLDNNLVVLRDPNEDQDDILRINRSREKQYVFDHAFGPMATQNEVYSVTTKPLIESVVTGYNATVFAYGATGAGKTYTMLGSDNRPGIMGLTLNDLFAQMESTKEDVKYKVTMSYLEIYNEMIRDLLNPASGILELREDAKGVNVAGLSDVEASTTSEVMSMLLMGNKQRTSEPTAANKTSSRSHAVLQVTVRQKSRVENVIQEVKIGKLFMIDLAGSERAAQTKNRGKRMIEGAHINRSLLALGNCINALSENRGHYVNFRDSKLTRLLKDSLGGNCKTVMIAHVSPAGKGFEESRNTLLYADRAKNIKTTIKRNQFNVSYHIAQYTSIIADLRKEIFRLKTKIEEQTVAEPDNNSKRDDEQYKNRDHTEMTKIRNELVSTFREQMEIRHKLMELEDVAMQIAIDTNRYMLVIDEWEQEKARRISKAVSASKDEVVDIHHDDDLLESPDEQRDKNGKRMWPKDDENEKDLTADPSIEDFDNKDLYEKEKEGDGGDVFSLTSVEEPEEVTFAKEEIDNLVAEEKRVTEMKANLQNRLVQTRKEIERLEELMPQKISGEENREILGLILKVHELEISNAELQSQALLRENVLRYKDLEVSKYESRQKLCDEIIQMQRAAITDAQINCSSELQALYDVYQQHPSDVEDRDSVSSARSGSQVSLSASTISLNRAAVLAGINRRMTSRENVFTFTSKLSPLTEETPSRMVSLQNSPTKRSRPTPPVVNTVIENDTPEISTPKLRPSRASSPDIVTVIKEPNNETFQPSTPVFSKTQKFTDLTARRRMIIDINTGSSSSLRNDDVISSKVSVRDSDRDSLRDRPIASYSESNLALNGSKSTVKSSQSMTDLSIIDNKASDDVSVDSVPITRKKSKKSRVEPAKISSRSIKRQRSASLDDVKVHKAKSRQHRKSQLPETTRNRTKHHQIPSKVRDRMSLGNDESSPSNNYKPVRERVSLGMEDPSPSSNARAKRSTHLPKSHHPDFSLRTRRDPIKQTTKLPHNDWNDGELQSFQSNMTPPSTVHQIGTPPGKGLTIHKRHRAPSDITGSDSNQSTPRLRPRRYTNHVNPSSMDGLSISGHAVRPSKQFGGSRRF